jgi:hypothetical protein
VGTPMRMWGLPTGGVAARVAYMTNVHENREKKGAKSERRTTATYTVALLNCFLLAMGPPQIAPLGAKRFVFFFQKDVRIKQRSQLGGGGSRCHIKTSKRRIRVGVVKRLKTIHLFPRNCYWTLSLSPSLGCTLALRTFLFPYPMACAVCCCYCTWGDVVTCGDVW